MRLVSRQSGTQLALLALLTSAALQFVCFARWPGNPMYDVGYSIFAAQNFVSHGQLKSLNMLADFSDDLAQFARPRWMVHFPPGHSLLYAAVMGLGLSAGGATKALGLAGIVAGGVGWVRLARFLGASRNLTAVLAAIYPWLPFVGTVYQLYETEQMALALMPWFCLVLLRIEPIAITTPASQPLPAAQWHNLLATILLALLLVTLKYSMVPVFLAASLYLLLQDGVRFAARSIWWKAAVLGLLLFPGFLFLAVNHAYGPRLQLADAQSPHFALQFARNILNTTISGTLGWDTIGAPLLRIVHIPAFPGLIDVISLASLAVWIAYFRRFPLQGRLRSFAMLLALATMALWLSLCVSTYLGQRQWDFSAEARLYMPITVLWLLCCAVSLGTRQREIFRLPAFYALALPIFLTAIVGIRGGLLQPPYPAMPQSGIAWTVSRDPDHAAFLSRFAALRGRKPDLLIATSSMMNELAVPGIYNGFSVPPGHHYWSSAPLEVWALVVSSQEKVLLADFSKARAQRVATPPRFPYTFYIFKFGPANRT